MKDKDRQEFSITDEIMIREMIKIGIDQTAQTEEFHLVVEYSVVKIIGTDQGMNKIIQMTLGKETLEVMWECIRIRILAGRIIEVDIGETIGMRIMKEVGVALEEGNIKVIQEGTIEVAVVDLGQDQVWVLIEIDKMLQVQRVWPFCKRLSEIKSRQRNIPKYSKLLYNILEVCYNIY